MKSKLFICLFGYGLFFQSCSFFATDSSSEDASAPSYDTMDNNTKKKEGAIHIRMRHIKETDAIKYEGYASFANSKLEKYYGNPQSYFVIDKNEFVNVFNGASGCETIRILFAETDQKKLIYGFEFLDIHANIIGDTVYDFDKSNTVKKYSKGDFQLRLNKYNTAGNTKSILDSLKPVITSGGVTVSQNTNTYGMEFSADELNDLLNYAGADFKTILVKIGLYSNDTIDQYIYENVIMLNFYRAKADGTAIGGDDNVYDLNSLCPPGNCN